MRSLTQQKIEHPTVNNSEFSVNLQQRNGGRRQPSASGKSAKNAGSSGTLQHSIKMEAAAEEHDEANNAPNNMGYNVNPANAADS